MRVPAAGEKIVYRNMNSKAYEVSVMRVEDGCVYFASPWTGDEIYALLTWQGDSELGWDFIEPAKEDPLDAIRKRLDALEAATSRIPKICRDYENAIRRLQTEDRCTYCGHESSTQDDNDKKERYILTCGFGTCRCKEPFHREKTERLNLEKEGNISEDTPF